jgi:flagellar protein FliO/FliZ
MPSTGLTVLWFLGVIALIPLTLWMLKRSGLAAGAMGGQAGLMKPVAQLNIGPGQRLVTVEVGTGDERKWLVLGVTAQQISALHTMAPQADLPSAAGHMPSLVPASFSALLKRSVDQRKEGA